MYNILAMTDLRLIQSEKRLRLTDSCVDVISHAIGRRPRLLPFLGA